MKADDLFPKEVRWVDVLSGLPFGVFYLDPEEARSLGALSWSHDDSGTYFGGFAVPPGHVLYQEREEHGCRAAFQRNKGTFWWIGGFRRSYHEAIYYAQNIFVPPKWWLYCQPQHKGKSDEVTRA